MRAQRSRSSRLAGLLVRMGCAGAFLAVPLTATAGPASGAGAKPATPPAMTTDPNLSYTIPAVSKPGYLVPATDPTFQSQVMRIGNNSGASPTPLSGAWGSDARHVYSKQQPWNSDQTLI